LKQLALKRLKGLKNLVEAFVNLVRLFDVVQGAIVQEALKRRIGEQNVTPIIKGHDTNIGLFEYFLIIVFPYLQLQVNLLNQSVDPIKTLVQFLK